MGRVTTNTQGTSSQEFTRKEGRKQNEKGISFGGSGCLGDSCKRVGGGFRVSVEGLGYFISFSIWLNFGWSASGKHRQCRTIACFAFLADKRLARSRAEEKLFIRIGS